MIQENVRRLSSTKIAKNDIYYLHYKSYHFDLFNAFDKYASGDSLDIGCGNKPYEKKISCLVNKYIGCDIVQSSLNKVDIIAPADNIPLESNTFNTVISTQTIEHVGNHQGLVDEAFRLLKPGGHFILSGPFNWQLHEEPYDFFRFSKHGFELILKKSGFEMIELKENGGMWSVVGQYLLMSINNDHSGRGRKTRFLFKIIKRFKGINLINRFFEFLDKADYNTVNTINYVIVARKNY
ncbi:class I SAM-dependent methyltransferase [Flavobacterium piscisymbiosum]|uniref:Class I SAM-dependent methyltransferase n=1 Tax=Flavobacterium piscisymbiosum TaxID=2893753 RepID=A0ABS8M8A6_9FLAO|nr:class I SAM-dependent methyltransferase [Flavobacterium sp. F-30]MCC9061725.1 class I SAM-dependent methyltransferase [Flavobacterium sp. F-30]